MTDSNDQNDFDRGYAAGYEAGRRSRSRVVTIIYVVLLVVLVPLLIINVCSPSPPSSGMMERVDR